MQLRLKIRIRRKCSNFSITSPSIRRVILVSSSQDCISWLGLLEKYYAKVAKGKLRVEDNNRKLFSTLVKGSMAKEILIKRTCMLSPLDAQESTSGACMKIASNKINYLTWRLNYCFSRVVFSMNSFMNEIWTLL